MVDLLIEHQVGVANAKHTVYSLDEDYWSEILGEEIDKVRVKPAPLPKAKPAFQVKFPLPIQADHKGHVYTGEPLDLDGNVKYQGQVYETPSGAAKVITTDWKAVNGWAFWRFFDQKEKQWIGINNLRK